MEERNTRKRTSFFKFFDYLLFVELGERIELISSSFQRHILHEIHSNDFNTQFQLQESQKKIEEFMTHSRTRTHGTISVDVSETSKNPSQRAINPISKRQESDREFKEWNLNRSEVEREQEETFA